MARPSSFKPEYGETILGLMAGGLSLAASAAEIDVSRQTVYNWMEKHPEFFDTIKIAQGKRQAFLEKRLLGAESSPVVTSSIFALKNAAPDDWRDKVHQEHSGPDGAAIEVSDPDTRELARAVLQIFESVDLSEEPTDG